MMCSMKTTLHLMRTMSLRIPDDLHAELSSAAEEDRRSLNRQIEWMLRQSLNGRSQQAPK